MSNPQDPNQWAQQGWQQPGQPQQDQTQISPQYGGPQQQPYGAPAGDQTQIAPQYQGQWPGQQQPQQGQQFGGYQQPNPQQPQFGQDQFGQPAQFAGQQFGQQFGQPGQPVPGGPKKSKTGLIIGIAAAAIIVIVALVLLIGWLTGAFFGKSFDNAKVNEGVTKVLKENYNESDTTDVSCKTDGVKVKDGESFDCTATIGGKQKTVKVTVKDSDGKYQVGAPS
ncbi:DUF4333 domain-containing protein [Tsukamurella pseudospumae]|uniref:DUF4333 domain-containing protein n=1 Tax=Tsukamurella pseudospumae TaxID=239498 RepID=A0A138AX15_9ACTN|nr:DUF4333 domain-containing protein [Tsukamurella pseudospumae]KXP14981.1 hypothetical protein AXK60_03715 [Tsukamurella pseudospumae]